MSSRTQFWISFSLTYEGEAKDILHPFTRRLPFAFIIRVLLVYTLLCFLTLLYSGLPSTSYILHLLFLCNLPSIPPQHIPGCCVDLPCVGMATALWNSLRLWDQFHFIVSQSFLCIHLWDFMQYSQNFFSWIVSNPMLNIQEGATWWKECF